MTRAIREERGFVLALALGITVVLGIMVITVVEYSSSAVRGASYSNSSQVSYSLAQAGLNNALAILNLPANNALLQSTLPACTGAESTWSRAAYSGGTAEWCGDLNANTATWTLKGVGLGRNPTGTSGGSVRRQTSASVPVLASLIQPLNNQAWNYIYATKTGDPDGCDEELHNSVILAASLYVNGNFCLSNSSSMAPATAPPSPAPAVNLVVKGSVTTNNTAHVGANGSPINQALIAGGCNGHSPCRWNGGSDPVWATATGTTASGISAPVADFTGWYANASPGPKHPCTTSTGTPPVFDNDASRNNSVPGPFDLTPASSYSCITSSGELSWDAPSKTLTVKGTIFIDGSVTVGNNATNNYNGQASLYVSGTFTISNSSQLCGGVSAGQCDFGAWNPNTEMLIVCVDGTAGGSSDYGAEFRNSSRFQGGVYATHAVHVANSALQEGPIVASNIDFDNSAQAKPFPLITTVPAGTPGNPNVYAQPQPPTSYTG
jgi:hypothetical protein